jgi:hypothetical protein
MPLPMSSTIKRVIYTNGHALVPTQPSLELYLEILSEDVRRIAGAVVSVHDVSVESLSKDAAGTVSLTLENQCGNFRSFAHEVPFAGELMDEDTAPHVGCFVRGHKFTGKHMLFHTLHGRLQYVIGSKTWLVKGVRSLKAMVGLVRELSQDLESPMFPVVTMLSATLRTSASIAIEPSRSLFWRVVLRLYSDVVVIQPRTDDVTNLFFMKLVNWEALIRIVLHDTKSIPGPPGLTGHGSEDAASESQKIRDYIANNDTPPNCSIGFTRRGVFFIRVTFPCGCVCEVENSRGHASAATHPDTVPIPIPDRIAVGGVEPFVNITARFVMLMLSQMGLSQMGSQRL